jgi:DNA-binding protein YbaB
MSARRASRSEVRLFAAHGGVDVTTVHRMTGATYGDQPSAAQRRVEEWAAQVAQKAERYQAMQARVASITVTESSGDGAVRLTVGSSGVMTDLELSDRATQQPARQLAAQIMETMRRAQGRLSGQVAEVMEASVGDDQETVAAVVSSYQQRFPEQPEDDAPSVGSQQMRIGDVEPDEHQRPAPPRRWRPPGDDDDDGWDRPLLRE